MKINTLKIYTSFLAIILAVISVQAFQGVGKNRDQPKIRSFRVKKKKNKDGVTVSFYWKVKNAQKVRLYINGRAMKRGNRVVELPLVMNGSLSMLNLKRKITFQVVAVNINRRVITRSRIITVNGLSKPNGRRSGKGKNKNSGYTPIGKNKNSGYTPIGKNTPLIPPIQISPSGRLRVQDHRKTVQSGYLKWRSSSGATSYGVQVQYGTTITNVVFGKTISSNTTWSTMLKRTVRATNLKVSVKSGRRVRWRVWSIRGGKKSKASRWMYFKT